MKTSTFARTALLFFLFTLLQFSNHLKAQIGGNQIYKERNNSNRDFDLGKIPEEYDHLAGDSTLVINVKVLMNKTADRYKLTLGLNEEAPTPKIAIENINKRIAGFTKRLASMGIKSNDIFVDFISQTKIYDYQINKNENTAIQTMNGFEIRKNIIITIDHHSLIEKLISEASDFEIHDIIKVDYLDMDIEKTRELLLKEAYSAFERKEKKYFQLSDRKIIGKPILSVDFTYVFPKNQYQAYTAFETSEVTYRYDASYIRKEQRKAKTFYYDGIDYTGFDKIINADDPEVGIQYVIILKVRYDLEKNKGKDHPEK